MEYRSYKKGVSKNYTLAPYLLKEYRRAWYVVGRDKVADKVKTFGLERIAELNTSEEHFVLEDFDSEEYFAHSVGITHFDTAPAVVRIRIKRPLSEYILANPFHRSQTQVSSSDDEVVIEMKVIISHELVNELLSWSPHIEILAPKALRIRFVDRLEQALAKHT